MTYPLLEQRYNHITQGETLPGWFRYVSFQFWLVIRLNYLISKACTGLYGQNVALNLARLYTLDGPALLVLSVDLYGPSIPIQTLLVLINTHCSSELGSLKPIYLSFLDTTSILLGYMDLYSSHPAPPSCLLRQLCVCPSNISTSRMCPAMSISRSSWLV